MSLQDVIKADVANFFLNTDDFAVAVDYTPAGGVVRHINGILSEAQEESFHDGNLSMMYIKRMLEISCVDDTNGVTAPKIFGKDGQGDSCVIGGKTWYVVDWTVDGNAAGTWMHELQLSDRKIGVTRK